jgi:hypothetical protein
MANITVDLTKKACGYVENLYNQRCAFMRTCEKIIAVCQADFNAPENVEIAKRAKEIYKSAQDDIKAIDNALAALHLFTSGGIVCSDGWPSNFNRIGRFITKQEAAFNGATGVFRAVMSAFGIVYECDKDSGVTIRYAYIYTYPGED